MNHLKTLVWARRLCGLSLLGLSACSSVIDETPPVEIVVTAPLEFMVDAIGELKAAKATPLAVPGTQFASRQLVWMIADGSAVKAGDVVARFSAARGEIDLAQARVSLLRNALTRAGKEAELGAGSARIDADLSQVATDLGIAERYASAELSMIARNELLDAVQDKVFLGAKQGFLGWKRDQTGERGAAELAVLDSQRESQKLTEKMRSDDLAALEIIAPHDGVLLLSADWSGERPRVGGSMWAGFDFGSLPDPTAMEVQFSLTQLDAAGIKVGAAVELTPLGQADARFDSKVIWMAAAAQQISRVNPIKYLRMKASISAEEVKRLGLVPGQTIKAKVYSLRQSAGLSVPNVALISSDAQTMVEIWKDGKRERRVLKLGERGLGRSQVVEGIAPGDAVILLPQREGKSA